jgi:hypothetical protein
MIALDGRSAGGDSETRRRVVHESTHPAHRLCVTYVCHVFGGDPLGHATRIQNICRLVADRGSIPLAPQLLFPQFLDERTERDLAMSFCLRLVALCDEVRVFGEPSAGMRLEIAEAYRLGIPVVDGATGWRLQPKGEPPR